jgi:hypothetical protein
VRVSNSGATVYYLHVPYDALCFLALLFASPVFAFSIPLPPFMGTASLESLPVFPILGLPRGLCQRSCAVKQTVNTEGKAFGCQGEGQGLGSLAAPPDELLDVLLREHDAGPHTSIHIVIGDKCWLSCVSKVLNNFCTEEPLCLSCTWRAASGPGRASCGMLHPKNCLSACKGSWRAMYLACDPGCHIQAAQRLRGARASGPPSPLSRAELLVHVPLQVRAV